MKLLTAYQTNLSSLGVRVKKVDINICYQKITEIDKWFKDNQRMKKEMVKQKKRWREVIAAIKAEEGVH